MLIFKTADQILYLREVYDVLHEPAKLLLKIKDPEIARELDIVLIEYQCLHCCFTGLLQASQNLELGPIRFKRYQIHSMNFSPPPWWIFHIWLLAGNMKL